MDICDHLGSIGVLAAEVQRALRQDDARWRQGTCRAIASVVGPSRSDNRRWRRDWRRHRAPARAAEAGASLFSIATARRHSARRRKSGRTAPAGIKATSPIPRRLRGLDDNDRRHGAASTTSSTTPGSGTMRPCWISHVDQWQRVFDVNLFAPIEISNAAVRRMGPGSAIVNVSSVLGQVSAPTRGPYCVSKSALISSDENAGHRMGRSGHPRQRDRAGLHHQRADAGAGRQRQFRSCRRSTGEPRWVGSERKRRSPRVSPFCCRLIGRATLRGTRWK